MYIIILIIPAKQTTVLMAYPEDIFGKAFSFTLANIFLTTTYKKLEQINLELPPNTNLDSTTSTDFTFLTTNNTHYVSTDIEKNLEDESFNVTIDVIILLHNMDNYVEAGWQTVRNLMLLHKRDKQKLFASMIKDVENELSQLRDNNVNKQWMIEVKKLSASDFDYFEFQPKDAEKFTGESTVMGTAIIFKYEVNVMEF